METNNYILFSVEFIVLIFLTLVEKIYKKVNDSQIGGKLTVNSPDFVILYS